MGMHPRLTQTDPPSSTVIVLHPVETHLSARTHTHTLREVRSSAQRRHGRHTHTHTHIHTHNNRRRAILNIVLGSCTPSPCTMCMGERYTMTGTDDGA